MSDENTALLSIRKLALYLRHESSCQINNESSGVRRCTCGLQQCLSAQQAIIDKLVEENKELRQTKREAIDGLKAEIVRLEKLVYVPGLWKCAKCGCQLIAHYMQAETGSIAANNDPQECPNECGPMWRVTERDAANAMLKNAEKEQCARGNHLFVSGDASGYCENCGIPGPTSQIKIHPPLPTDKE